MVTPTRIKSLQTICKPKEDSYCIKYEKRVKNSQSI